MNKLNWEKPLKGGQSAHDVIRSNPTATSKEICNILISLGFKTAPRTVQEQRASLGLKREEENYVPSDTDTTEGNTRTILLSGTRIKNERELIAFCEIDLNDWKIVKFEVGKWEVGRKDTRIDLKYTKGKADGYIIDTGTVNVEPLYRVRVVLERKVDVISARAEIEALKSLNIHIRPRKVPKPKKSDYLLELSIPDAHFGRLADPIETDGPRYDLAIARDTYLGAVQGLVARTQQFPVARTALIMGNDQINIDNLAGTTTKGTPQLSSDGYYRIFSCVRDTAIFTIETLRDLSPVDVYMVPGNHDRAAAWHLGDSLAMYFRDYRDVKIDYSPSPDKFLEWGRCMVMFTHGEESKAKKWPLEMVSLQPEMYGRTRFHEIHGGHTHTEEVFEQNGIVSRRIPSIAPADRWTRNRRFTGGMQRAQGFVWHKEEGLVNIAQWTVVK